MPLQNRSKPKGELCAVPQRGTMMGNRGGKFHRDDKTLSKRRWASHHWICCELHYKGAHHEPMGQGYTSVFFLDEVTALAAGHRPCFYCRHAEAKAFLGDEKVEPFDRRLHAERLSTLTLRRSPLGEPRRVRPGFVADTSRLTSFAPQHEDGLLDGVMVEIDNSAFAVRKSKMLRWSFDGYLDAIALRTVDKVLTPPSIIAILASGYKPRWHSTAQKWDDT